MIYVLNGTQSQKSYAYSMAAFVCNKFDINPEVEISFRSLTNEQSVGGCVDLDDGEYEVDIKRSLKLRDMLITLAHEMVHVKQYELGEMKQFSEAEYSYWDKPSEIEAHALESELFNSWVKENNLQDTKWVKDAI